jgi:hypothetical protein
MKPTEFVPPILSPEDRNRSMSFRLPTAGHGPKLIDTVCCNTIIRTVFIYLFIYSVSFYHQVWTALIPHLPLRVLLQNLRRLGRLWLLKGNRPIVAKMLDALNNQSAIAESDLHPALVFVSLRNYECLGKYVS